MLQKARSEVEYEKKRAKTIMEEREELLEEERALMA